MGYQGIIIPIPVGTSGLDSSTNPEQVRPDALIKADNIKFDNKTVTRAGGLVLFNSSAISGTPDILEATDWHPDSTTQSIITVASDANVYVESVGDLDSAIAYNANVTIESPITFVEAGATTVGGNRNLYIYCADFPVQVIEGNGTVSANISNSSSDWTSNPPYSAIYHDGRIWAFGNSNYPHALYCSDLLNHGNFDNDFNTPIYDIYPGEGEGIRACYSYLPQEMVIFKYPRGIYTINTSSVPNYFLPVAKIRDDIGVASPHSVTKVGSFGIWFMDTLGHIYDLQTISDPGLNPTDADITEKLNLTKWIEDTIDKSKLEFSRLYYDAQRKEVWATYTSLESTGLCDYVLILDVRDPNNVKACIDNRGEYFQTVFSYRESTGNLIPYCAGTGGFVYKSNQSAISVNGTAYTTEFQTPHTDLGWYSQDLKLRDKRFDWLDLVLLPVGSANVTVSWYIDGELYDSQTLSLGGDLSLLDDSTYYLGPVTGTHTEFTLLGGSVQRYKLRIGGRGQKISFLFTSSAVGEQFSIISMNLYCRPLSEKGQVE